MDGICLFLNGDRGLHVLRALRDAGHGITCVYVPVGKETGDIGDVCRTSGVAVEPVADVNAPDFVDKMRRNAPSVSVIAGYSTLFRRDLIAMARLGTINLHAGRLPMYRGGSPLNWQIINAEASAGLSVIRVDEGIDSGAVLAEGEVPIGANDTIADVHARANEVFPRLVLDVLDRMSRGKLDEKPQDEGRARYWHQRNDADGRIDWRNQTARQVHNLVRAITRPYGGAHTQYAGRTVRIFSTEQPSLKINGSPGRIVWLQGKGPYVVCADEAVLVTRYEIADEPALRLRAGTYVG